MYKYTLDTQRIRVIPSLEWLSVSYEYVEVYKGIVTIKEGYAWDGATPKIKLFGKWIGTPDGKNEELKYPTLWHDALTQYGIGKKKDVDLLFKNDMKEIGWKYYKIYYLAVRLFGWIRWNRHEHK